MFSEGTILPHEKQWDIVETWVGNAGGSQYDIIASWPTSLELVFFFLEICGVLRGRTGRL